MTQDLLKIAEKYFTKSDAKWAVRHWHMFIRCEEDIENIKILIEQILPVHSMYLDISISEIYWNQIHCCNELEELTIWRNVWTIPDFILENNNFDVKLDHYTYSQDWENDIEFKYIRWRCSIYHWNYDRVDENTWTIDDWLSEIQKTRSMDLRRRCFIKIKEHFVSKYGKVEIEDWKKIYSNGIFITKKWELRERLKGYNIAFTTKLENADYILIWDKNSLDYKKIEFSKIIFESNLEEFFNNKWSYFLKQSDDFDWEYLQDLLMSSDDANIKIWLELIKNWWIPEYLKTEIIGAYFSMKTWPLRSQLWKILKLHFDDCQFLSKFNKWSTNISTILSWLDLAITDVENISYEYILLDILKNTNGHHDYFWTIYDDKILRGNSLYIFFGSNLLALRKVPDKAIEIIWKHITEFYLHETNTLKFPQNFYEFVNVEKIVVDFGDSDFRWKAQKNIMFEWSFIKNFSKLTKLKEIHLKYKTEQLSDNWEIVIDNIKTKLLPHLVDWCRVIMNWEDII